MKPTLTPGERQILGQIPESDLASLAAELSIAVPDQIDGASLAVECIVSLAQLARTEGLPLSKFDRDDLEYMTVAERTALAELCGYPDDVSGMIKAGTKVYKNWRRTRPRSPIALMLPVFLPPLARFAAAQSSADQG